MQYHTLYTNDEFEEEYFQPFLKFAEKDDTLGIDIIRNRQKRGKRKKPEIESQAIRALIKKYVDYKRKQAQAEKEKKQNE